ncbi:hypothetical protein CF336_g8311 [Tilletia laevis]|uniref:Uncharacterized protein n=1 Tax=Tilletia caries TaxID=13290 RepID=A0A8T8SM87_9BASI|nr:hypothetical protein CF336_g8311 [Tilletia laevis]KAE8183941.1 hypothetical protein CF335_g8170 [Tilletia laevis]KAE8243422.1 hypothetical protein A4X03_0g7771 [Tilletia caries]CAD6922610.1 unnamed protein product [Tilletia caries]
MDAACLDLPRRRRQRQRTACDVAAVQEVTRRDHCNQPFRGAASHIPTTSSNHHRWSLLIYSKSNVLDLRAAQRTFDGAYARTILGRTQVTYFTHPRPRLPDINHARRSRPHRSSQSSFSPSRPRLPRHPASSPRRGIDSALSVGRGIITPHSIQLLVVPNSDHFTAAKAVLAAVSVSPCGFSDPGPTRPSCPPSPPPSKSSTTCTSLD